MLKSTESGLLVWKLFQKRSSTFIFRLMAGADTASFTTAPARFCFSFTAPVPGESDLFGGLSGEISSGRRHSAEETEAW